MKVTIDRLTVNKVKEVSKGAVSTTVFDCNIAVKTETGRTFHAESTEFITGNTPETKREADEARVNVYGKLVEAGLPDRKGNAKLIKSAVANKMNEVR